MDKRLLQRYTSRVFGWFRQRFQRAVTSLPWLNFLQSPGRFETTSADRALRLTPVYAAVRLLSTSIAAMPLQGFRDLGDRRAKLQRMPRLFASPTVQGTRYDWVQRAMVSLTLNGNAYGLITEFDGFGHPLGIEWLPPNEVSVDDSQSTGRGSFALPIWRWNGIEIPLERMVHIPWVTMPGRVKGLSPLGAFASVVEMGIAGQNMAANWFLNGGIPPGTFKNTAQTVSPDQSKEVKRVLMDAIRTGEPIVYGRDWDFTAVALSPREAQFVETMRLSASQVASIYGIPAEMIGGETSGGRITYENVEAQTIHFIVFTLLPWVRKLEDAFDQLIPEGVFVRFNLDSMVRTDLRTRHEVFQIDRRIGLKTVNELRTLEDNDPLADPIADSALPLNALVQAVQLQQQPETEEPAEPEEPEVNGNGNNRDALERYARR
ncbi:MAG: phage portal protein [Nitriliruptorales bacterium]|nr:phage portal protein [Nitriliruptorales bacterium]